MIIWNENKSRFANSQKGYIGKIRAFELYYKVIHKEDRDLPYVLTSTLPQIKIKRFSSIEEAKQYAEQVLDNFLLYITDRR